MILHKKGKEWREDMGKEGMERTVEI